MKRIDYNNVTALIPMPIYFKLLGEKTKDDFTQAKTKFRETTK